MKFYVAFFICLLSLAIAAQQPAPPKAPSPPAGPQAPSAPAAPVTVVPHADQEQGGQPVNIRLDVSVADQAANSALLPKTLMVILVDRGMGRTRAAFQDRFIAVDARPVIVDNRIRVYLTIQSEATGRFGPPSPSDDHTINWRNSFSLLLDNGKPMVALETSDAVTKRKLSIEVKATIQK